MYTQTKLLEIYQENCKKGCFVSQPLSSIFQDVGGQFELLLAELEAEKSEQRLALCLR